MTDENKPEKDNSKDQLSLINIIPQISFDIIAWIIPGFFISLTLALSTLDLNLFIKIATKIFETKEINNLFTFFLSATGFILSYLVSNLLNGVWPKIATETIEQEISAVEKYHLIKCENPEAGQIILKVKAKKTMSRVMFVGLVLSAIINATHFIPLCLSDDHWGVPFVESCNVTHFKYRFSLEFLLIIASIGAFKEQSKSKENETNLIKNYYKIIFGANA